MTVEQVNKLKDEAKAIMAAAKSMGRELSDEEITKAEALLDEAKAMEVKLKAAEELANRLDEQAEEVSDNITKGFEEAGIPTKTAKTLGDQFVTIAGEELKAWRSGNKSSVGAEVSLKALPAAQYEGDPLSGPYSKLLANAPKWVAPIDRQLITDVFPTVNTSLPVIPILIEGDVDGKAASVEEGGEKPLVHLNDPTLVNLTLKKIPAFDKISFELLSDLPVVAARINNRLIWAVLTELERQVIAGDGTNNQMVGILNTAGIQTADITNATAIAVADAVYAADTQIQIATNLNADTVFINPVTYQALRLAKDSIGQYYGGSYFEGNSKPGLWGFNTVISVAIPADVVLVGNVASSTTLYQKDSLRIDSTNSDGDDFRHNLISILAELRAVIAVERPKAYVKINLDKVPTTNIKDVKARNLRAEAAVAAPATQTEETK